MIITDAALRPSDRLIQAIRDYFEKQGYTYQKSQRTFVKKFEHGNRFVSFSFRIGVLTHVTLGWSIQFEKLEKLFAQLNGFPKNQTLRTLATDMPNHTRWLKNVEHTFDLYDEVTLRYDDFSINNAANKIFKSYEEYTVPYFEKFSEYKALEVYFNQYEFKNIRGIILAKYMSNPNFTSNAETLEKQIKLRNADSNSDEAIVFRKTLEFLEANNIKEILD